MPDQEGPLVEPKQAPASPPVVDPSDATGVTPAHIAAAALKLKELSERTDDRATTAEAKFAIQYLDAFGYLCQELSAWRDIQLVDLVRALGAFQEFFGLTPTGHLDARTVRAMEGQRCGYPDQLYPDTPAGVQYMKVQEFAAENMPRWRKTAIKYAVEEYLSGPSTSEQDAVFKMAFAAWEQVCGISIERAQAGDKPDILIGVGRGQRSNFDGPGGTLAWAYLPQGDDRQLVMRFDADEVWVINDSLVKGTRLLNVATHEFGHLLGLGHSRRPTAIMAPYYNPKVDSPQDDDDVARVQNLYGPRRIATLIAPKKVTIEVFGDAVVMIDGKAV